MITCLMGSCQFDHQMDRSRTFLPTWQIWPVKEPMTEGSMLDILRGNGQVQPPDVRGNFLDPFPLVWIFLRRSRTSSTPTFEFDDACFISQSPLNRNLFEEFPTIVPVGPAFQFLPVRIGVGIRNQTARPWSISSGSFILLH